MQEYLTRWRRRGFVLLLYALVVAALVVVAATPGDAATDTAVVSATVANAVSLDTTGCASNGGLGLDTITPGSFALSGACAISFGSNTTATLSMWQRDERGDAFEQVDGPWTTLRGSSHYYAIDSPVSGTAWMGGSGGTGEVNGMLRYTTDGGATWAQQSPCVDATIQDIDALSSSTVYLVAGSDICMTTTSGVGAGAWTSVMHNPGAYMRDVKMLSPTNGWALSSRSVYHTIDGVNWTTVYTEPVFANLIAMSVTAGGSIYIAAASSNLPTSDYGVVYSLDSGATWGRQVLTTMPGKDTWGAGGALALSDTEAFIGQRSGTWHTVNSGVTWTQVDTPALIADPVQRSDGTLLYPFSSNALRKSVDGGSTWSTWALPTTAVTGVRDLTIDEPSEMWIVGQSEMAYRSTDNGGTWQKIGTNKPNYNGALGFSDQKWVAFGSNGVMARATDGLTLVDLAPTVSGTLWDGLALTNGVGIVVGSGGSILRTTNAGATWNLITSPVAGVSWKHVIKSDTGKLWIAGSGGNIASSLDDGMSWSSETAVSGSPTITAIAVRVGKVWVGDGGGTMWTSSATAPLVWTSLVTGRTGPIVGIGAISASTVYAVAGYEGATASSYAIRSVDGGATWSSQVLVATYAYDMHVDASGSFAWIAASGGQMQSTTDAGASWSPITTIPKFNNANAVVPIGTTRLLAVGNGNSIARSSPPASFPQGMSGGGSGFGACLETAPGAATVTWNAVGSGSCTTSAPAASWQAIGVDQLAPTTKVATVSGSTATVNLVFGARTALTQRAGTYAASIVVEATAPG